MKYTNALLTLIAVLTTAVTYRVYRPVAGSPSTANSVAPQGDPKIVTARDTVQVVLGGSSLSVMGGAQKMVMRALFDSVVVIGTRAPCDITDCSPEPSGPATSSPRVPAAVTLHAYGAHNDSTVTFQNGVARLVVRRER